MCDMVVVRERLHLLSLDFILEADEDGDGPTHRQQHSARSASALRGGGNGAGAGGAGRRGRGGRDRRHRFLAMDVTTEGSAEVAKRLSKFVASHHALSRKKENQKQQQEEEQRSIEKAGLSGLRRLSTEEEGGGLLVGGVGEGRNGAGDAEEFRAPSHVPASPSSRWRMATVLSPPPPLSLSLPSSPSSLSSLLSSQQSSLDQQEEFQQLQTRVVHASKYASASCELELVQKLLQAPMLASNPTGSSLGTTISSSTSRSDNVRAGVHDSVGGSVGVGAGGGSQQAQGVETKRVETKGEARAWKRFLEGACRDIKPNLLLPAALQQRPSSSAQGHLIAGAAAAVHAVGGRSPTSIADSAVARVLAFSDSLTPARTELIEDLFTRFVDVDSSAGAP
jgi:hypothetical protein